MKKREKQLLLMLLHQEMISFDDVLEKLNISRRTLYYDIQRINELLENVGEIIKHGEQLYLEGNHRVISYILQESDSENLERFLNYDERKKYIVGKILIYERVDVNSLAQEMYVSETTVTQTIKQMKDELTKENIVLHYDNGYHFKGCERSIRDLFLMYYAEPSIEIAIDEKVEQFNQKSHLELADFSKSVLTRFVAFLQIRIEKQHFVEGDRLFYDTEQLPYFNLVPILFDQPIKKQEQRYIASFVSSLSSLNPNVDQEIIHSFVKKLLFSIENNLLIMIDNKEELSNGIIRHLYCSYNRIKYQFPIYNPLLEEIKFRFESLFRITKNLFLERSFIPELSKIREEEIAFIVSYLGAYILKNKQSKISPKVLIVCPNGITVSKTIEYQVEQYFPQLDIVNVVPISKIDSVEEDYDYIISTVEIENIKDVIVVNPILRNVDLDEIGARIFQQKSHQKKVDVGDIMETIKEYADIEDENQLKKALYEKLYQSKKQQGGTYMLEDLLVKEHIHIKTHINTWEDAIIEAAKPLVSKNLIEERYVKAMIDSVNENGPYIVIDQFIALAHARPKDGVNRLSMSLLKLNQSVDFLGEEVKVVVILAATDNTKHIHALASLTELFMNEENKEKIIQATDIEDIHHLIKQYS